MKEFNQELKKILSEYPPLPKVEIEFCTNEIKNNNELRQALQAIIRYSRMMRFKRSHLQNTNATLVRNTMSYQSKQALNKIITNTLQVNNNSENYNQSTYHQELSQARRQPPDSTHHRRQIYNMVNTK